MGHLQVNTTDIWLLWELDVQLIYPKRAVYTGL